MKISVKSDMEDLVNQFFLLFHSRGLCVGKHDYVFYFKYIQVNVSKILHFHDFCTSFSNFTQTLITINVHEDMRDTICLDWLYARDKWISRLERHLMKTAQLNASQLKKRTYSSDSSENSGLGYLKKK